MTNTAENHTPRPAGLRAGDREDDVMTAATGRGSVWRSQALAECQDLRSLLDWVEAQRQPATEADRALVEQLG